MGEEMASSLGLSYAAIAAIGLILAAITVSTTVITVGAIPFVGPRGAQFGRTEIRRKLS